GAEPAPLARAPAADAARPAETRPEASAMSASTAEPAAEPQTAWLELHVRDRDGHPVAGAKVRVDCYRTSTEPGASNNISPVLAVETEADGIARLEIPRRLRTSSGPERDEIVAVCLEVEHSDFVTLREWSLEVDRSPAEIVLQHGALLIVAGFRDDDRSALV